MSDSEREDASSEEAEPINEAELVKELEDKCFRAFMKL